MLQMNTLIRKHWPNVLILAMLQLLARPIMSTAYRMAVRPRLIRAGARPCQFAVTRVEVSDCDLILERQTGDTIEQSIYIRSGSVETRVVVVGGAVASSTTVHWDNMALLVLPFAAVVVAFVATLLKIFRTGSFFTWQLARHPWSSREKTLLVYSVPLVLEGIVQLALNR
jgi:hypothetical protein